MGDSTTIVVLLTITVILLALVIVALLAAIIILVVRINKIVKNIEAVSTHVAEATEWLSPVKVFSSIVGVFRR